MRKKIILLGACPETVADFLKEKGFDFLVSFRKGSEALEELKSKEETDLVLADISLPDMDGFSFLQQLKKIPKAPPVIIITSVSKDLAGNAASKEGAFAYFQLPLDKELLLKRINYALRFKEIFEGAKIKKLPELKQIKGHWGEKIKNLIQEVKTVKLKEAREKLVQGKSQRTLEIALFLRNIENDALVQELIKTALASSQEAPVEKTEKNLGSVIKEAWAAYLNKNYEKTLELCKNLLLNEEREESVKILNAILSREEISEETARQAETEKRRLRKLENKNPFAYISIVLLIASVFYKPLIIAPLACVFGFISLKTNAKRAGTMALVGGFLILLLHLLGIKTGGSVLHFQKPEKKSKFSLGIKNKTFSYSAGLPISIRYKLPAAGDVEIKVVKYPERKIVRNLKKEYQEKGKYEILWDGMDDYGNKLKRGVYLIQLEKDGEKSQTGIFFSDE